MSFRRPALALASVLACALPAVRAATVALPSDGQWLEFNVDDVVYQDLALHDYAADLNQAASYSFTVASGQRATLTVVDLGFAGDQFTLSDNGRSLGSTHAVQPDVNLSGAFYLSAASADQALADGSFSQGTWSFGEGSHTITGVLSQSLLGMNSTNGALRLTVSAVPEPASAASLLAGLGLLGAWARRRRAR